MHFFFFSRIHVAPVFDLHNCEPLPCPVTKRAAQWQKWVNYWDTRQNCVDLLHWFLMLPVHELSDEWVRNDLVYRRCRWSELYIQRCMRWMWRTLCALWTKRPVLPHRVCELLARILCHMKSWIHWISKQSMIQYPQCKLIEMKTKIAETK